jgi:protein-glutamine gamma-glutamyltransferase
MIIVSDNPFQIINQYPNNSIEQYILTKMNESTEKYRYDSLEQLHFELKVRKEIINAAKKLNNSKFAFAIFHKSKCNPEYWTRTNNGGFRLNNGANPGSAINDIFINGDKYATECATAMLIVYYKALLDVLENSLFDRIFPEIYLMNWHSVDPLLRNISNLTKVKDFLPGDRGYFTNPDVDPKTPEWQGENVIILSSGMYYGHGIGINSAEEIIAELNNNRKNGATRSAYFLDSVGRLNFKKLFNIYSESSSQAYSSDSETFSVAT